MFLVRFLKLVNGNKLETNQLSFLTMSGESKKVVNSVVENCQSRLKRIIGEQSQKYIFNAEKTSLIFKCMSYKTLHPTIERCFNGEKSKGSVSIIAK